ncbi:MAG: redox-regulated ATPase YchF [candidate division WOR-3 bacterium]|nr:MAG: redox-regulated ATPase YchF [candidate division WOR-3 bacterium]
MKVGIVGLPNTGKSSLFNLLTRASARVDSYPFTTIDKNVGVVLVPDDRLDNIGRLLKPEKLTPAHIRFVDIAGLVKGASKGEGLGNRFLAHIRETDLILHIVRNFSSPDIPHVFEDVDPDRDVEVVEAELAIADLAVIGKRLERLHREPKTPENRLLSAALDKLEPALQQGLHCPEMTEEEQESVRELGLFKTKPVIYGVNCSDSDPVDPGRFPKLASRTLLLFSAALESGMQEFAEEEKAEMRTSLGLAPEGPDGIVARCFDTLDLIRFYTVKGEESRAWAAHRGTTAIEAAAMIHTDIAKGFIKAEVLNYDDLARAGSYAAARDQGKLKIEGKTYGVQDGDVLLVRFRN